jgi:hypothetical protein
VRGELTLFAPINVCLLARVRAASATLTAELRLKAEFKAKRLGYAATVRGPSVRIAAVRNMHSTSAAEMLMIISG